MFLSIEKLKTMSLDLKFSLFSFCQVRKSDSVGYLAMLDFVLSDFKCHTNLISYLSLGYWVKKFVSLI